LGVQWWDKGTVIQSAPSEKQLEQQAKFSLVAKFMQPLNGLFFITFRNFAHEMTGINSALSYLLSNAVTGTYPSFSIDFANVLISRDDLPNVLNPAASAVAGNSVQFAWTDNSGAGKAKATDKTILVIYNPADKMANYTTGDGTRSEATETLPAAVFGGQTVETYIGFISDNGRFVASSIYTGQLTLVP
jgi:hypothetical protein